MKLTIEHQDGTLAVIETDCVKLSGDNLTMSVIARVLKSEIKTDNRVTYIGTLWPHQDDGFTQPKGTRNPK